jgi:RNA polymerase-binding transcription factor DksA
MPTKKQAAAAKKAAPKKQAATPTKATTKTGAAKASAAQQQAAAAKTAAPKAATPTKATTKTGAKKMPLTKSPFDAKFLEEQRQLLEAERANYTRQSEALLAEAESLMRDREPGDVQFDEESGEGDTLAVERERDLALSAQARAAIEEIDAALERIANGTYGICRVSGLAIPKERLRAIPWATERVEYKVGGFARR